MEATPAPRPKMKVNNSDALEAHPGKVFGKIAPRTTI
jgi:hypothetical protein